MANSTTRAVARRAPTLEELLGVIDALKRDILHLIETLERAGLLTPAEAHAKLKLVQGGLDDA